MKANVRAHLVEFVNENEGIVSAYAADEINRSLSLVHVAASRLDQQSLQEVLSLNHGACFPSSPSHEGSRASDQSKLANLEEPITNAINLDPNLPTNTDGSDKHRHRAMTQRDQKRRAKSPELKYQTFQRIPNFDAFRPLPRSHFSSDAVSVWPLRSIEESRLLQHFIQYLAAWVCLRIRLTKSNTLILRVARCW